MIWRTRWPVRSEATRRNVKYDSEVDLFRVWVLRMNMVCKVGLGAARVKGMLYNYGTTGIRPNSIW